MAETQVPGTSATESSARAELEISDQPRFTVGPPEPVTDPQQLPAVTAEQEADFVSRANRGIEHPDNAVTDADDDDIEAVLSSEPPEPSAVDDEDLPSEAEMDDLVAVIDVDDVDDVGFDDADLDEPLEIDLTDSADEPSVRGGS